MRQARRHVPRPLRTAAPEHSALQLLALVFADVEEDVGPGGVGGAVGDVLQVGLGELAARAQLLHLHVARPHHQRVVFAGLLAVSDAVQQVADGVLRQLPVQGEDLLRAQVVDFK